MLFFLHLESRRITLARITRRPTEAWITQMARNAVDETTGALRSSRYLLRDRDAKFCAAFDEVLASEGIHVLKLPPRSPNLNAYASHCTSFEPSATTDAAGQRILSFLPCALRGPSEPEGLYRYSGLSV